MEATNQGFRKNHKCSRTFKKMLLLSLSLQDTRHMLYTDINDGQFGVDIDQLMSSPAPLIKSFILREYPGLFVYVGISDGGFFHNWQTCNYSFIEETLR